MTDVTTHDPLARVLPEARDRSAWRHVGCVEATDTGDAVFEYEHRISGRTLRLDGAVRVYGQDAQGVVRLFGRGGPLALAIALNAVFDGLDQHRPSTVVLPTAAPSRRRKG